jgi:hypothetical protein
VLCVGWSLTWIYLIHYPNHNITGTHQVPRNVGTYKLTRSSLRRLDNIYITSGTVLSVSLRLSLPLLYPFRVFISFTPFPIKPSRLTLKQQQQLAFKYRTQVTAYIAQPMLYILNRKTFIWNLRNFGRGVAISNIEIAFHKKPPELRILKSPFTRNMKWNCGFRMSYRFLQQQT